MLLILQNIDMSYGFSRTLNISNVADIENVVNVAEY